MITFLSLSLILRFWTSCLIFVLIIQSTELRDKKEQKLLLNIFHFLDKVQANNKYNPLNALQTQR